MRTLVRASDRVVGVEADRPDGACHFDTNLVVGADGRYSTVRKLGAFAKLTDPQIFDVLNYKVPFPDFWPDRSTVRLELGPSCITGAIPTSDGQLWVGMTIQKGQYKALRSMGAEGWAEELLQRISPRSEERRVGR